MAVAGCGVATFVLISRRNVVANSGSHAGVSAVSNSMIKKAGILALVATLALTSAFSFSKAFAGGNGGGGRIDFSQHCDSEGYQTYDWKTYVTVDDGGNVTNVEMYYLDKEEIFWGFPAGFISRYQGASPIRVNSDTYKWINSLFNENAQNVFSNSFADQGGILYPCGWLSWTDLRVTEPGEDFSLREDLLDGLNSNGTVDVNFDIPFERQTKVEVTFDYGYEGSTPYVMTLDWADFNLERHNAVTIPIPSRDGYEFLGWNEDEWPIGNKYYADFSDVVKVWDFYINGLYSGDQVIKGYWKQADSTNDINANVDQTDSTDTDLNADVTDVDTQDVVSEQNTGEFAQSDENNADLVDSADLDASAVKED